MPVFGDSWGVVGRALGSPELDVVRGYARDGDFRDVDALDALDRGRVRRLAAMALRFVRSPYSDRGRDLARGVAEVLGIEWRAEH